MWSRLPYSKQDGGGRMETKSKLHKAHRDIFALVGSRFQKFPPSEQLGRTVDHRSPQG